MAYILSFPLFAGLIKQFLADVHWGEIDYLLIDTPPGTSDEHLSIVQYLKSAAVDGAVLVTTPQVAYQIFIEFLYTYRMSQKRCITCFKSNLFSNQCANS